MAPNLLVGWGLAGAPAAAALRAVSSTASVGVRHGKVREGRAIATLQAAMDEAWLCSSVAPAIVQETRSGCADTVHDPLCEGRWC